MILKYENKIIAFVLVLLSLLTSCGENKMNGNDIIKNITSTVPSAESETEKEKTTHIFAVNDNFTCYVKFNGRVYRDNSSRAYYFNYSLSGFEFSFHGTGASAYICSGLGNGTTEKNAALYVYIDDYTAPAKQIYLNEKKEWFVLAENLENGDHTIKISKRTDISYSSAGIKEIKIEGGKDAALLNPPASKERKIEFLGDSITSGDGVLSTGGYGSYITEFQDAHYSYAKVTADYFGAECNLVSRCGLGLVWNSSQKAPEDGGISLPMIYGYQNYYDDINKTEWDFSSYVPDIIVINIGTNDRKQVTASREGKKRWMDTYIEFLKFVREKNHDVPIICCYGSMIEDVDLGLEDVVNDVTADGMTDVYYLRFPENDYRRFSSGVGNHPTISKQKYDAEEYLIPLISKILDW